MIHQLNKNNFKSTVDENKVVLVDFYADWCGPCKAMQPALESIAKEFDGQVAISKVNVDQNPELSKHFKVRSIPAIFYFKNGELVAKQAGLQTKQSLSNTLNELLAGKEETQMVFGE